MHSAQVSPEGDLSISSRDRINLIEPDPLKFVVEQEESEDAHSDSREGRNDVVASRDEPFIVLEHVIPSKDRKCDAPLRRFSI